MYISGTTLVIIIAVAIAYFHFKNKSKQDAMLEKGRYFNTKYKKHLKANQGWYEHVLNLSKMVSDQLNLMLIQRIAESDGSRYEKLTTPRVNGDALEEWIATDSDSKIVELREMRELHNTILREIDEINNLHQSHLPTYLEKSADWNIELALDDLMGSYIFTEAFYRKISELKCLTLKKVKAKPFLNEGNKLVDKLEEIKVSLQDRYYQVSP